MIPTITRLNGKVFTRNSCAVRVNGVFRLVAVDSIDWSDEVATELVNGMNDGGPPIGKAAGPYSCDATLGILADSADEFESLLLLSNPLAATNLSAVTFQLVISMREDIRTRTVVLANCNVKGRPSRTVGNDGSAIIAQYALQPTQVLEDGKSLVNLLPAF